MISSVAIVLLTILSDFNQHQYITKVTVGQPLYNRLYESSLEYETVQNLTKHENFDLFDVQKVDKWIQIFYCIKPNRKIPLSVPITFRSRTHVYLLLFVCGDISLIPGPVKNPCGKCNRPVAKNHRAVKCEACYFWLHIKCEGISPADYVSLCHDDNPWTCKDCPSFHFTDSFFEYDEDINMSRNKTNKSSQSTDLDIFDQLSTARRKHPKIFLCAYLNINSLRHKFDCIKDLLIKNTIDLLFIAETKLDDSFPNAQFMMDNYHLWRADRTQNGGSVAAFLRSDIAGDRQRDLEFKHIEGINIEVNLNETRVLI